MKIETLSLVKDPPTTKPRTLGAMDASSFSITNRATPEPELPARKGLRLDVDDVLNRSLPKVSEY
jgi:hypothetical protein